MDVNFKRYGLYLIRWQLSTPILAGVLALLGGLGALTATIIANLIGGLIFFWVDRFIFTSQALAQWESGRSGAWTAGTIARATAWCGRRTTTKPTTRPRIPVRGVLEEEVRGTQETGVEH